MAGTTSSLFKLSIIVLISAFVCSAARVVGGRREKGSVDNNCFFHLSSPRGEIKSPGYPYFYPNDLNCTWTIRSNRSVRIILQVHAVDLEPSKYCEFDRLFIYDGPPESGRLLRYYCNQGSPDFVRAEADHLSVVFKTDGSESGKGFYFSYVMESACKEIYTEEEGFISSPGFPNGYPGNMTCTYAMTTKNSRSIRLEALTFELAPRGDDTCNAFLAVVKDTVQGVDLLSKHCGSDWPKTLCLPGNAAILKFNSGKSSSYPGFRLHYKFSDEDC